MTMTHYKHWRDVPATRWRWKNFSPAEIVCRGTGSTRVHEDALDKLQALRDRLRWVFIAVAIVGIGVTIYARIDDWKRGEQ